MENASGDGTQDQAASLTACVGRSAHGQCAARPRYSVSEHIDQRTDYRVCGRHLSWFVDYLTNRENTPVVVARLVRGR